MIGVTIGTDPSGPCAKAVATLSSTARVNSSSESPQPKDKTRNSNIVATLVTAFMGRSSIMKFRAGRLIMPHVKM